MNKLHMKLSKHLALLSIMFMLCSTVQADQLETEEVGSPEILEVDPMLQDASRGMLSVPINGAPTAETLTTTLVDSTYLTGGTKNFCVCRVYKLLKSVHKTIPSAPNYADGDSLIRMTASGATFDMSHNCLGYCPQTPRCDAHGVAIEVGYGPNQVGVNSQPNSVIIENGLITGWDIGVVIHQGVRNVTIRNMVFADNVLPIAIMGRNDSNGNVDEDVVNVTLENVTILGPCEARRKCLAWIKSKLSTGVQLNAAHPGDAADNVTALNPYGYDNGETPPCVCDPIADTLEGAFAYTGLYAHGVTDLRLKNVHVSQIGFDEDLDETVAVRSERTVAYGMWLRNSKTIFMEDVASLKNKSALAVAGVMFDNVSTVSVKNGKFTNNTVTQHEGVGPKFVCPDGLWAAGVVWKDSQIGEYCDVVLSENFGIDHSWGFRVIHSSIFDNTNTAAETPQAATIRPTIDVHSTGTESLGFENTWADGLRADKVYGFDFGDMTRHLVTSFASDVTGTAPTATAVPLTNKLPAGKVEKLRMKNVTVRSAAGKVVGGIPEDTVAQEFKGIYLGDQSRGITIDGAYIGSNNVASTATGFNSGIEFGTEHTNYEFIAEGGVDDDLADFGAKALAATGEAVGTINDLRMNDLHISSNTGGSGTGRVVGIRAISTGTNGTYPRGDNEFADIHITNSRITANQFDGMRMRDDVGGFAPVTTSELNIDCVVFNHSIEGYGFNAQRLQSSQINKGSFNHNVARGAFINVADSVTITNSEFNENDPGSPVIGCDISESGQHVRFENTTFNNNRAIDGDSTGLHVESGQSIELHTVEANSNTSQRDVGVGPYITRGLHFETSVDNLGLYNVDANNNIAHAGNVNGIEVERATSVHADGVHANNNQAEGENSTNGNVSTAKGIFFKAAIGSKNSEGCLMKNLQAAANHNAHIVHGIHMQDPVGVDLVGVDASSNVSDAQGQVDSLPVLSQAVGLKMEGGGAVHITDLRANANYQTETIAANLSRYLEKGVSVSDSEANPHFGPDIAHHFAVANRSGAYGVLLDGTHDVSVEGGSACKNTGVRAFGIHARSSDHLLADKVEAHENRALGTVFHADESPFVTPDTTTLDSTALDVPDSQADTLFGDIHPASTVNVRSTYERLVKALNQVVDPAVAAATDDECTPCVDESAGAELSNPKQCIAAYYNLIWASLAAYRRFSTAVGIGLYNSSFGHITNSRAMGNSSMHDSAGGIAMYGRAEGGLVSNCTTANNEGHKNSERGGADTFDIDGNIDLSSWHELYKWLKLGVLAEETVVAGDNNDTYKVQAMPATVDTAEHIDGPGTAPVVTRKPTETTQSDGVATTGDWLINSRKLTVGFTPANGGDLNNPLDITSTFEAMDLYNFVAIGSVGVGILLECHRDGHVSDNNTYGNKGHAGLGVGILSDSASATMHIDNKATHNAADIAGHAWGIADLSYATPNIWYKNWMYANRVDQNLNSHHLIQFSGSQSLPLKTISAGDATTLVNALPVDNIAVNFENSRQLSDCVGDSIITSCWEAIGEEVVTQP